MDNIVNYYPINDYLEVCVCDDEGTRVFTLVHHFDGTEEQISESAARAICINPDSTITPENWDDFCTARGYFTEDN